MAANSDFPSPTVPPHLSTGNLTVRKNLSPFIHSLTYYHCMNISIPIFLMDYNPLLSLSIFLLKLSQIWSVGVPSRSLLCHFDTPPLFFWALPYFVVQLRCSRFILYLPVLAWNPLFFFQRALLIAYKGIACRNPDMEVGVLHCCRWHTACRLFCSRPRRFLSPSHHPWFWNLHLQFNSTRFSFLFPHSTFVSFLCYSKSLGSQRIYSILKYT